MEANENTKNIEQEEEVKKQEVAIKPATKTKRITLKAQDYKYIELSAEENNRSVEEEITAIIEFHKACKPIMDAGGEELITFLRKNIDESNYAQIVECIKLYKVFELFGKGEEFIKIAKERSKEML